MTDTPRTLAQIKAMFANNSTGDISEQDMRDFVESLVNPVTGGGFEERVSQAYPGCDAVVGRYNGAGQVVPNGYGASVPWTPGGPLDVLYDPSGLIQTDSYFSDYWGFTFPPYSWAKLPQGVWLVNALTTWGVNGSEYRTASIDVIETYAGDGWLTAFGSSATGPNFGIPGNSTMETARIITVPPAEVPPVSGSGAPYEVGYVFTQASGAPISVYYGQMSIKRLSF